ncbi:putative oxidoreductase YteT isoform X2 [Oratosquilla oratoria]|uniref:putative oxidoreductase YteT isoform X2 n=1 Tax=Oratosquilla oratoria TaxID=337810 RepID=UPI003F76AED0
MKMGNSVQKESRQTKTLEESNCGPQIRHPSCHPENNMGGLSEPSTFVVVGAGHRGEGYARYALQSPNEMKVVGVAEPQAEVRRALQKAHGIPEERCYVDWQTLALEDRIADCVIIGTQDEDHVHSTTALAAKGYHILLEKPMATTAEDCRAIYRACQEAGIVLAVCHVLRYFPPVQKIKELIDSGAIGEVTNINHTEPVGFWHFGHSFVRGNWAKEKQSAFSLLTKSCHDVDLIAYWMSNTRCTKISSFGSLLHFKKEKQPEGAASRCLDCKVERSCPYSARRLYLDPKPQSPRWPMSAICPVKEPEKDYVDQLEEALQKGPYGKCVYDTDNDVCDNQVVNFEFENGATATLTMVAHSELACARQTIVYGSHGQLSWDGSMSKPLRQFDFRTKEAIYHDCQDTEESANWGHGGADYFIVKSFIGAVAKGMKKFIISGPEISLQTHLLCFAAEHSRRTGRVVDVTDSQWSVDGQSTKEQY